MNHKTTVAMLLAGLMVTSGFALAAAPSTDSETTVTSTTSELTDGSTIVYNGSTNSTHSFTTDSENVSLTVKQNGTDLATYTNDSSVISLVKNDSANSTWYWNATFDDNAGDFTGIEAGPGENTSLTLKRVNDTSLSNPDISNITVYFENDANRTFVRMGNDDTRVADNTTSSLGGYISALNVFGNDSDAGAAEVEQDIGVAGADQEAVTVYVANSDAQDSLAAVYDANDGQSIFSTVAVSSYGGSIVPVFAEGTDTPDWFNDSQTYMTVSEDGETIDVVNPNSSLDSDDSETTMSMTANDAIGFGNAWSIASDYGGGFSEQIDAATSAFDFNGSPELAEV